MDDLNLVGNMHWKACDSCDLHKQCGDEKNKAVYVTTHNEVICKNHSNEIFAEIGTLNMMCVCINCKVYDKHFKDCGLNTIFGLPEIKMLITTFEVRCLSFESLLDA